MGIFLNSIIFPIMIIQFVHHLPVVAKYVLSPGDELNSLNPTSTLASAGGIFTLGFFKIPSTSLTYLGIWYTNDARKVWVANRDVPMNSSGILMIDESGTLKVVFRGGGANNTTLFIVSNEVVGSGNTRAVLEDSGNFVLYDVAKKNLTLWQSFDHPTDTLLPGMKLGYNLTTTKNWTLTSWLSDQIPASGAFTLRLEKIQNSPQLVIYQREKFYWSSGPWVNQFGYEYSVDGRVTISDASGMYFAIQTEDIRVISMLQLSSMGQIMDGGNNFVFLHDFCYISDKIIDELKRPWLGDCAISTFPNCRSQDDKFDVERGEWYSGDIIQTDDSLNISLSDCMERCWNDCNCKGFTTSNNNGTGCTTWGGDEKYKFIKVQMNTSSVF